MAGNGQKLPFQHFFQKRWLHLKYWLLSQIHVKCLRSFSSAHYWWKYWSSTALFVSFTSDLRKLLMSVSFGEIWVGNMANSLFFNLSWELSFQNSNAEGNKTSQIWKIGHHHCKSWNLAQTFHHSSGWIYVSFECLIFRFFVHILKRNMQ